MAHVAYWAKALGSLGRNLTDRQFARSWISAGIDRDRRRRCRPGWFPEEYPETASLRVALGDVAWTPSNMDPTEQYILGALALIRGARTIFEIGTYDGATTSALAQMVPAATIYTLDLPDSSGTVERENANIQSGGVGSRFRGAPEADRIHQLYGDSRTFDFSSFYGRCDLVLIDGGHEPDCAVADTNTALELAADRGVIVWDDYMEGWPGVVYAVDEIAAKDGATVRFGDLAVLDRGRTA